MSKDKGEIISAQYGPFQIVDVKNSVDSHGKEVELKKVESICRCGKSKYYPYCDGSHGEAGFVCEKSEDRTPDKVKDYVGKDITIHDNRGVCSHDGSCIRLLPEVFRKDGRPWINPDGACISKIIDTIEKCPSGALSFTIGKRRYQEWGQQNEKITFVENGPIKVEGGIKLKSFDESNPECKEHYTLCRCGKSKNKPFCDGSHID